MKYDEKWNDVIDKNVYLDQWKGTNRSVTIVTAFLDIGKFPKGTFSKIRNQNTYKTWMGLYQHLQNPLVVYTNF